MPTQNPDSTWRVLRFDSNGDDPLAGTNERNKLVPENWRPATIIVTVIPLEVDLETVSTVKDLIQVFGPDTVEVENPNKVDDPTLAFLAVYLAQDEKDLVYWKKGLRWEPVRLTMEHPVTQTPLDYET